MNDNICLQDHLEERDRTLTRTSIQIVICEIIAYGNTKNFELCCWLCESPGAGINEFLD